MNFRKASIKDLPSITRIYNWAILHTTATFDLQEKSNQEQESWFFQHENSLFVCENNNEVIGWAAFTQWLDRCAYADTVEFSIYVDKEYQKAGVGSKLMQFVLEKAKLVGLYTVLSRITSDNTACLRLHEKYKFDYVGLMKGVGVKFDRRLDVWLMQKIL